MAPHDRPDGQSHLIFNGKPVPTLPATEFMAGDSRRPTSFITNFGDWQLPRSAEEQLHSAITHLEWFHDTGELVAFGQVPYLGAGEIQIDGGQAAIDILAGPFGGASGRIVRSPDGATREFFPAMVVDAATLVAIIALIEHGPRVHQLLWGWHLEHRHADGWDWLQEKLKDESAVHPDDAFI
jgi:hypothetical protein